MVRLRGDEKARYVAAMFDRISGRYDLLNTVMTWGMHHRWRRRGVALAVRGEQGAALDVATGTGDFALELARVPTVERVVGLDFAPRMLSLGRRKAQSRRLSQRVHWMMGDALALPFPDDHFLCVTCGFGLRNLAHEEPALREMARVVRPGGRVVVLDMSPLEGTTLLHSLIRLYTGRIVPRLGALFANSREAYTYLPESAESFLNAQELVEMMERLGLERVEYHRMGLGTVALHVGEKPAEVTRP